MNAELDRPEGRVTSRVFRKIEEIPPGVWKDVFPDVLENYTFFKSLDESGFQQFSFYYILVYEDGEVAGVTSCFLMSYPLETTVQGPLHTVMALIKRIFPEALNLRALICGLPMDQGRMGIRSARSEVVVGEILACMERIARENKIGILAFKDFGLEYGKVLAPLKGQGFYKFQNLPSTDMNLNFNTFEEYLKTLSRVSRDGLKRKLKKLNAGPQFDLEITHRLTPQALSEVYALYLQTVHQADVQFETVPQKFFERVAENMPDETHFFLWRMDGRMVAFAYCLVSKGHFLDFYLGFDYAIAHEYHLYFVRFRDMMQWCLENKMKKYEMGATGYEAKRRLGFQMIPVYIYAKHRNCWINPFFNLLCYALRPENFHAIFKDMKKKGKPCPPKD